MHLGDISSALKAKAGLKTPTKNDGRTGGVDINPGSDEEDDSDEDLFSLQGTPEKEEVSDTPEKVPENPTIDDAIDVICEEVGKVFFSLNPLYSDDVMRGCFIQPNVPDPYDPGTPRERLCIYAIIPTGMNVNSIEVHRPSKHVVEFKGRNASGVSNAPALLGNELSRHNKYLVSAMQKELDALLLKGSNGEAFRSIPNYIKVDLPTDKDFEKRFINPFTNLPAATDPLVYNKIESSDRELESDVFIVMAFLRSHTCKRR